MLELILAAALTLPPQKTDTVIGITAVDLESGKRVSMRGSERFPMGSVYKVPIALATLRLVDIGRLRLDQEVTIEPKDFSPGWSPLRDKANGQPVTVTVRELLRQTVAISDNTTSDALLRLIGGPTVVTTRMAELSFGGIRIDRSEKEMARDLRAPGGVERYAMDARDTTSPDDMAGLLTALWKGRDGLSKESHDLLVHWMTVTQTGPRRLKAAIPGATIIHKTGTMPGTTNDAGIVVSEDGKKAVVIAIFTKRCTKEDELCEDDLAAAAREAYIEVTKRGK
ncbi:MAG TPA: class A beta-lactamase [Thermoanaerobaculia bacterium]|nr:class A beta-lactamase [Thermoanaerobaculia bacterium]